MRLKYCIFSILALACVCFADTKWREPTDYIKIYKLTNGNFVLEICKYDMPRLSVSVTLPRSDLMKLKKALEELPE